MLGGFAFACQLSSDSSTFKAGICFVSATKIRSPPLLSVVVDYDGTTLPRAQIADAFLAVLD